MTARLCRQEGGAGTRHDCRSQLPAYVLSREASVEESGALGKSIVQNKELGRIEEQLRSQEESATDGLCRYLLGVILAQKCASAHLRCIRSARTCSPWRTYLDDGRSTCRYSVGCAGQSVP